MVANNNLILTVRPDNKKGMLMKEELYRRYRDYLLMLLLEQGEMKVQDLFSRAAQDFNCCEDGKIIYELLMVKLDLEARDLIRSKKSFPHGRFPVIYIKRGAKVMLNIT